MPAKMKMQINNYNQPSPLMLLNTANLAAAPQPPKAPSALSAPMLKRVHNVRPGCGSCGGR